MRQTILPILGAAVAPFVSAAGWAFLRFHLPGGPLLWSEPFDNAFAIVAGSTSVGFGVAFLTCLSIRPWIKLVLAVLYTPLMSYLMVPFLLGAWYAWE